MTPPADVPKQPSTEAADAREQPTIEGNAGKPTASEEASSRSTKGRAAKSRTPGKPKDTQDATRPQGEQPEQAITKEEQPANVEPIKVENPIAPTQSIPTQPFIQEERPIKEELAKNALPAIQVEQPKSTSATSSVQSSTPTPSESTPESTTEVLSSTVVPTGLPVLAKLTHMAEPTSDPHHHQIIAAGVLARASSPYLPKNRPIRPHESDEERSASGLNLMGFLD